MPLSYSTSSSLSYTQGKSRGLFYRAAMASYQQGQRTNVFFDAKGRAIAPPVALVELKMEMRMSPAEWELFTKGYMRENFATATTKDFIKDPTTVVASFLAGQCVRDESRRTQLLFWAVNDREFIFLAECLEEQMGNRHWHAKDYTHLNFVENYLLAYWVQIYTYNANFCNTTLILSLIAHRDWPVPTKQDIMQSNDVNDKYKLKWIRSLKTGRRHFANVAAFHILNNPSPTSGAMISARDAIYPPGSLKKIVLSFASTNYWKALNNGSVIFRGGNVVFDLLWGIFNLVLSSKLLLVFLTMIHLVKLAWMITKQPENAISTEHSKVYIKEVTKVLDTLLFIHILGFWVVKY